MGIFEQWVILSRMYFVSIYKKSVETVYNQLGNFGLLMSQKSMDNLEQWILLSRSYFISRYEKNVETVSNQLGQFG